MSKYIYQAFQLIMNNLYIAVWFQIPNNDNILSMIQQFYLNQRGDPTTYLGRSESNGNEEAFYNSQSSRNEAKPSNTV